MITNFERLNLPVKPFFLFIWGEPNLTGELGCQRPNFTSSHLLKFSPSNFRASQLLGLFSPSHHLIFLSSIFPYQLSTTSHLFFSLDFHTMNIYTVDYSDNSQ